MTSLISLAPEAAVLDPVGPVSVVVPTFREADNIAELVRRVLGASGRTTQLIIVDDESGDGTREIVNSLGEPRVELVSRYGQRGLSSAVLVGMSLARHGVIVVLDADLSHAPEEIPTLVACVRRGADMAVGSRYVAGGSVDSDWGLLRRLNSLVGTAMARPLASLRDPLSGFFAIRRRVFQGAADLNPTGYKIGLELLVKCRCRRVDEVPIQFHNRQRGRSKLTFKQQALFVEHLRRLMAWKLFRAKR